MIWDKRVFLYYSEREIQLVKLTVLYQLGGIKFGGISGKFGGKVV